MFNGEAGGMWAVMFSGGDHGRAYGVEHLIKFVYELENELME